MVARMREHAVVLCLQDTTELDYNGQAMTGLGPLSYEAQRGLLLNPTRSAGARRVRHDRSARVARPVDLVPHHQFAARAGLAGRGRAAVRTAQLGRAKLQTDEG